MDARVEEELQRILEHAVVSREAADDLGREDVLVSAAGYAGAALTTMIHLDLVNWDEFQTWLRRFMDVLGMPLPEGWNADGPSNN